MNEAATMCRMGANLKAKSVEYTVGKLEPNLYTQLVRKVMPHLRPLTPQDATDHRIKRTLADSQPCGENQ